MGPRLRGFPGSQLTSPLGRRPNSSSLNILTSRLSADNGAEFEQRETARNEMGRSCLRTCYRKKGQRLNQLRAVLPPARRGVVTRGVEPIDALQTKNKVERESSK